jgi:putative ABC transport system permease protein
MFKNYFKIAWRNLWKNKFYSLVNITGLAIGLSVGIMILLWVQDEFSYDSFHTNADNIYKINSHLGTGADEQVWEVNRKMMNLNCANDVLPEKINKELQAAQQSSERTRE